ncbi:hypothetical protein FBU30_008528 [Linnemannia zychae]|nr:hypothetical protein FBU30_008528 [Linnemannia zychae]
MSSAPLHRSPTPVPPHLAPQHPTYASSILSGSRSPSPASLALSSKTPAPSPPQSPKSFHSATVSDTRSTSIASPSLASGTSSNVQSNTIISIGNQFQQQSQRRQPSSPPSQFAVNSPNLFSFKTITSLLFHQSVTRIVVAFTVLQTLLSLGGKFPERCSAPSQTIYKGDYLGLLMSPFVIPLTPALLESAHQTFIMAIMLGISNLISFGLFEEHLTASFRGGRNSKRANNNITRNGTRIFRNIVIVIVILVMGLRQLFGFIFNRAIGWAYPPLYISDSVHECNLVIQAFLPDDPNPTASSSTTSTSIFAFRRIYVQIILCLFNIIPKAIVWWAASGLIVGFVLSLGVAYQRRMGRWGGKVRMTYYEKAPQEEQMDESTIVGLGISNSQDIHLNPIIDNKELSDDSDSDSTEFVFPPGPLPLVTSTGFMKERSTAYIFKRLGGYVLPMVLILLGILIASHQLYYHRPDIPNDVLNNSIEPATPFLLTLVLMTAPRRDGIAFIKQTLSSYLEAFPDADHPAHPLFSRIQIVVYTHVTDYPGFDEAQRHFETDPKARQYVKWIREEGTEKSQRKHLISAIRKVGTTEDTVYLGIMEDDFPFCENGFQAMLNLIYKANQQVKNHCGLFITTGGSGLIFKRSVALTASFALEQDVLAAQRGEEVYAPDVALQNCMLGRHDYCSSCKGNMVISGTILQRHLGHNASTSGGHYRPEQYQCGWRHPFNGFFDTVTL